MDAYRGLARRMLAEDGVEVVFGCSLSASRKAVLSTMERHNGLLWYPSIYEGFEYSENVIYTGATLNQSVFALADFLLQEYGSRVFMVGSDYIYPRESNRVMRDLIETKGGTILARSTPPSTPTRRPMAGWSPRSAAPRRMPCSPPWSAGARSGSTAPMRRPGSTARAARSRA